MRDTGILGKNYVYLTHKNAPHHQKMMMQGDMIGI